MRTTKTFLQPEWIVAILITAAAVGLHLYFWLHTGGLWRDEANMANDFSRHSFSEMARDSTPLLGPLAVHGWMMAGGQSDLALRFLGLLFGLGLIAVLWMASWKVRRAPPLAGLVLFGLSSTVIIFGDSLRPYGPGSLFAMALVTAAFVFLQKPSITRVIWLALFAVLSVQTLYHNVVIVAAVCFGAWAVCWRRKDKRAAFQVLCVAALAAISLLPGLHALLSNPDASQVLRKGMNRFRFVESYENAFDYPVTGYIYDWILLAGIIIFRACLYLWQKPGAPAKTDKAFAGDDLCLFASVTLILAAVGFPIFFWHAQLTMATWYLIPLMALAAVCFDAALPVFRGILRVVFLAFVVITAVLATPKTFGYLTSHFSNVNRYSQLLMEQAAPGDYIVVCPWNSAITFDYYFKGPTPWETLPPLSDHSVHRYDLIKLQMQNTNAIAPVLQQISRTLQSGHRVWVLADTRWMDTVKPGTPPLSLPPPPPLKYFGWADSPYLDAWTSQASHFIADHSSTFQKLPPPQDLQAEKFTFENMKLFVANGWKTNQ